MYVLITFFDFFLLVGLICHAFWKIHDNRLKGKDDIEYNKRIIRRANILGVFVISSRLFKLVFYLPLFGHSLSPIGGTFAKGFHTEDWYECKLYSMPFMEGFCSDAVESFHSIEGACYPKQGYYPEYCTLELKKEYDSKKSDAERDQFIKEHIRRADKMSDVKRLRIYNYLARFAIENKYLQHSIIDGCVKDMSCKICVIGKTIPVDKHLEKAWYVTFRELEWRAQNSGKSRCYREIKNFSRNLTQLMSVTSDYRDIDINEVSHNVEKIMESLKPGLSEEFDLNYIQYRPHEEYKERYSLLKSDKEKSSLTESYLFKIKDAEDDLIGSILHSIIKSSEDCHSCLKILLDFSFEGCFFDKFNPTKCSLFRSALDRYDKDGQVFPVKYRDIFYEEIEIKRAYVTGKRSTYGTAAFQAKEKKAKLIRELMKTSPHPETYVLEIESAIKQGMENLRPGLSDEFDLNYELYLDENYRGDH